jgi:excisionase family DNA binding protein
LLPSSRARMPASEATIAVRPDEKGGLLTVRAVAARLGVCRATAYDLVSRGALPHVRISNAIRIAADDLAAHVARHRNGVPA